MVSRRGIATLTRRDEITRLTELKGLPRLRGLYVAFTNETFRCLSQRGTRNTTATGSAYSTASTTGNGQMKTRRIADVDVSAIGFGGMPISIEGRPDEAQAIATIHAALDEGITLFDTADAYHLYADEVGHNESLIARGVASWGGDTSDVLIATKGGHLRPGDGSWTLNGRPEYIKKAAEASLRRLGVEAIGLYQFHRPDPEVPYEDSVGAIRDLLDEGKIRLAGISNADPERIRLSQEILGGRLASVQNQFSPAFRSSERELELCDELGIAFLPWSPLGGIASAANLGDQFGAFRLVAEARGVSPQVVCLAWHLSRSPRVIPIPGASRPASIRDSATAADLELTDEEIAALDASGSGETATPKVAARS